MLCTRCKKREARVFYTEVTNGQKKEEYLCEECAAESTSFQAYPLEIGNFITSILGGHFGLPEEPQEREPEKEICCPSCSMSLAELVGNGKAGCAGCYDYFGKELGKAIRQIQGADTHKGKRPKRAEELTKEPSEPSQLERLGIQLQEAIEKEEFEEAARLRDEIRARKAAK